MSDAIAPIQLQVIGAALRSIAEEMGAVLIRSSFSANIKERRDCSTALFDERGRMVAQAEHIPVHLGAMPDAVAAVMQLGLETVKGLGAKGNDKAAVLKALFATKDRASVLGTYGFNANGDTTLKSYGLYKVGSNGDPVFLKTITPTKTVH